MESLYRKYRPQTFQDVVGQQHVVSTLEHAVLEGRTSHAYLFCGPRGTGKTTMARLLAKALMCEQGAGRLPDGTCGQCQLIAAGEHPDVYELDAASRTGVDNVREEIISRVGYAPVRGSHKVYIIDEVHMLTTAAFNALLKTLEEPPGHVVFVLCTTDPQKVPETILSRVQRFDFHAIGTDDMLAHLRHVCVAEGFSYDDTALELVVRHARGGMRDALSTLEQLSVFGDGSVSLEAARDLLGEVSGSALVGVSCAIAKRDVPALFGFVGELVDGGRDLLQFTRELAAHLRDVYVVSAVGVGSAVVGGTEEERRQLRDEALAFGSPDRVSYALTVISDASNDMRTATNQRLTLEVALTKIARPKSDLTLESLADRVAVLERRAVNLGGEPATSVSAPPASAAPAPQLAEESEPASGPAPVSAPTSQPVADPPSAPAPKPSPVARPAASDVQASAPQTTATPASPAASSQAVTDGGELQRRWRQVVDGLVRTDPPRGSLLMSSTAVEDNGSHILVNLPKGSSFACMMLDRKDIRAIVEPAVEVVFGRRTLTYVESSLAGADIARAGRSAASAPAAIEAQRAQAAPQPQAVSQPQTAPVTENAPQVQPQPSPEPSFSAPWEEPSPATDAASDAAPLGSGGPASQQGIQEAPAPAATSEQPQSQAEREEQEPLQAAPDPDMPQEMDGLLAMLTDVFGDGVTVSVEHPNEPSGSEG